MKNKEFKVLLMDINKNTYEEYDILPYFGESGRLDHLEEMRSIRKYLSRQSPS